MPRTTKKQRTKYRIQKTKRHQRGGAARIPDWETTPGYAQSLVFTLRPGERITAVRDSLIYKAEGIDVSTGRSLGNQSKSIFRKVTSAISSRFSEADLFYNNYTNKGTGSQRIAFSSHFPGTIRAVPIPANSSYYLYEDCLLCMTDTVQTSAQFKADIASGDFLTIRYSTREEPGMIWIYSAGNILELPMREGQRYRINDKLLLAVSDAVSVKRIPEFEILTGEGRLSVAVAKRDTVAYIQTHPKVLKEIVNKKDALNRA